MINLKGINLIAEVLREIKAADKNTSFKSTTAQFSFVIYILLKHYLYIGIDIETQQRCFVCNFFAIFFLNFHYILILVETIYCKHPEQFILVGLIR